MFGDLGFGMRDSSWDMPITAGYFGIRIVITFNLAYNCGLECPDDHSVLRHFGTVCKVSYA